MRKLLLMILGLGLMVSASAQKTRAELEKERASIQREIDQIRKALSETEKSKKSSLAQLSLLQRKLALREKAVNNVNQEIRAINDQMYLNQLEINKLRRELDTLKLQYAESLVYAYKNRTNYDFLNFIFSAVNFNDAVKRVAYLKSYRAYRDQKALTINKTQQSIEQKIVQLRNTRQEKDVVLAAAEKERKVLAEERNEQRDVVSKIRSKEKDLQREIANKRAQDKKLQTSISAVIRKEAEAARLAERKRLEEEKRLAAQKAAADKAAAEKAGGATAANNTSTNKAANNTTANTGNSTASTASKGTETSSAPATNRARSDFELTPEGVISSTNFESNRGTLPWPVETGVLVYGYGSNEYQGTGLKFENNGYTIQTPIGQSVKAVFDGEVKSVMYLDPTTNSQMIMVQHGKYFSVYGGVTGVSVKKGDNVRVGQSLGKVVTSEEGVGELEFYLLIETRYLNPAQWLKRK